MINFIYGDHEIINGVLNIIFFTALLIAMILLFVVIFPYVRVFFDMLSCPPDPSGYGCLVP